MMCFYGFWLDRLWESFVIWIDSLSLSLPGLKLILLQLKKVNLSLSGLNCDIKVLITRRIHPWCTSASKFSFSIEFWCSVLSFYLFWIHERQSTLFFLVLFSFCAIAMLTRSLLSLWFAYQLLKCWPGFFQNLASIVVIEKYGSRDLKSLHLTGIPFSTAGPGPASF